MEAMSNIKWLRGGVDEYINSCPNLDGYHVLIMDKENESGVSKLKHAFGPAFQPFGNVGFVEGVINVLSLHQFINVVFATRLAENQPRLPELTITVVDNSRNLALSRSEEHTSELQSPD